MQIDENKRARSALKGYFAKNAIPTEGQFAQLIDSFLNQRDDGLVKVAGDPLSIEAAGDAVGFKRAVNFYLSFADADPAWTIALKPRSKPADAGTSRTGWSVNDSAGNSRLCIDQATGNVGIGTIAPNEKLEVAGQIRVQALTLGAWPPGPQRYSFIGSSGLNQADGRNYAMLQDNQSGATFVNSPSQIYLRVNNADRMFVQSDGVSVVGSLRLANSDVYFTEPAHSHTGIGNAFGCAAIENSAGPYNALMILGRNVVAGGLLRVVKLWDRLEVNGAFELKDDMSINDKHALRGNDGWLRLNQDGAFPNGTHTPRLFAPMSLNVGGVNNWGNPGNNNAIIAGDLLVMGHIGAMGKGPGPLTPGWGGGMRTWDLEVEASTWSRNAVQTGPRDVAEIYFSENELEIGDVVALDEESDGVAATSEARDSRVIGIVSKEPGLLLGSLKNRDDIPDDGRSSHPVALAGCTPCKVTDEGGPIRRGDLLTSASTPGHAMRAANDEQKPGIILGKALEAHAEGEGMIDVFVMLR